MLVVSKMVSTSGAINPRKHRTSTDSDASVQKFLNFGSNTDMEDNFVSADFSTEFRFLLSNVLKLLEAAVKICSKGHSSYLHSGNILWLGSLASSHAESRVLHHTTAKSQSQHRTRASH